MTPDATLHAGPRAEGEVRIRAEEPADVDAIRDVNDRAFGGPNEGRIVDALRAHGSLVVSLVAISRGRIVGHVAYSPVRLGDLVGAGLGPLAVVPGEQRRGIGTLLVEAGNRMLESRGCPFVVVLGHPRFYPRVGFSVAKPLGVTCQWSVADEAFMIRVLDEAAMSGVRGVALYGPEFSTKGE